MHEHWWLLVSLFQQKLKINYESWLVGWFQPWWSTAGPAYPQGDVTADVPLPRWLIPAWQGCMYGEKRMSSVREVLEWLWLWMQSETNVISGAYWSGASIYMRHWSTTPLMSASAEWVEIRESIFVLLSGIEPGTRSVRGRNANHSSALAPRWFY